MPEGISEQHALYKGILHMLLFGEFTLVMMSCHESCPSEPAETSCTLLCSRLGVYVERDSVSHSGA